MGATTEALKAPADAEDRVRSWVEAFLTFFVDQPDAFRLLFREPWGSGDPRVTVHSSRAMVELSRQLADPLGLTGASAATLVTSTTGTIGFVVAVTEQLLAGQVDHQAATASAADFIIGGLGGIRRPRRAQPPPPTSTRGTRGPIPHTTS
jgi:hypothetical protein